MVGQTQGLDQSFVKLFLYSVTLTSIPKQKIGQQGSDELIRPHWSILDVSNGRATHLGAKRNQRGTDHVTKARQIDVLIGQGVRRLT